MKLTQKKVDKLFIKAVEDGNLTEVKYLLNDSPIKANLHLKNEVEDPEYILLVATYSNQLEILKYFLEETKLKKYTKYKGKEFLDTQIADTLNMMYEYAGSTGNLDLIKYLNEKLYLEDKYNIFLYAALDGHVHVLKFLLDEKWLSNNDLNKIKDYKNRSLEYALNKNKKESVYFLLNYLDKHTKQNQYEKLDFYINNLLKVVDGINKESHDFELFNYFYESEIIQNNLKEVSNKKLFNKIASKKNLELYKTVIEGIKDKELKKEVALSSIHYTMEDEGKLKDYPLAQYVLNNYKSYFNKEKKELLFYQLIYDKSREKFDDLMEYNFLLKGTDPNNILREAIDKIDSEDTYEYIKKILSSEFKSKIKIHFDDNILFRTIYNKIDEDKNVDILNIVISNYDNINLDWLKNFYGENDLISKKIDNAILNKKLSNNLETKEKEKKLKI